MDNLLRIPDPEPFERIRQDTADRRTAGSRSAAARSAGALPFRRPGPRWSLEEIAGGIVEIATSGPGSSLNAAARLLHEAQENGEPAAWIAAGDSLAYPPDLHDCGIDLEALPIVRVKSPLAGARAAEHLLRSGAFGLIVIDLGRAGGSTPTPVVMRLSALCRRHHADLLLLARKPAGGEPLVPLASLRVEGEVAKTAFDRFTWRLRILKDKRQGAGWSHEEVCRGPDGLC